MRGEKKNIAMLNWTFSKSSATSFARRVSLLTLSSVLTVVTRGLIVDIWIICSFWLVFYRSYFTTLANWISNSWNYPLIQKIFSLKFSWLLLCHVTTWGSNYAPPPRVVKYFYHIYVTIMKGKRKLSSYRSLHGIEKYYLKDCGIQKVASWTLSTLAS